MPSAPSLPSFDAIEAVQELPLTSTGPAVSSALAALAGTLRAAAPVAVGGKLVVAWAAAAIGWVDAVGLHEGLGSTDADAASTLTDQGVSRRASGSGKAMASSVMWSSCP